MQVKKKQIEPDTEQQTDSKWGMEYVKTLYCHLIYLTSMPSTVCEILDEAQAGVKIARRFINNFRYADNNTHMAESKEELKSQSLDESERGEWKSRLKIQHSYN